MPETTNRLPRARTRQNPEWVDALDVYKRSFDATSAETLTEGAEAFAEMSPDDQAFHLAHLTFRQVQALGDVYGVLRRIEAQLGGVSPETLADLKHLPHMRKALVSLARGQNTLLRMVADGGGLAGAMSGDDDDDRDDDDDDDEDDRGDDDDHGDDDDDDRGDDVDGDADDDLEEEEAEEVENEDHGNGDAVEVVVPEVLPARREPPEVA